jgi:hypothetical protein
MIEKREIQESTPDRNLRKFDKGMTKERTDTLLVYGRISVHPGMVEHVPSGGSVHVRMVDPLIRRAYVFKLLRNVNLPCDYEIRGSDIIIASRYDDIVKTPFYVEAFYIPGDKSYKQRASVPGGEAWGSAGKMSLMLPGAQADIQVSFFWTKKMLKGSMKNANGVYASFWLDVADNFRKFTTKINNLTIEIKTTIGSSVEDVVVIARKKLDNVDVNNLPLDIYILKCDLVHEAAEDLIKGTAFFEANLELFSENGEPLERRLEGYRASRFVQINGRVKSLRLILNSLVIKNGKI